MNKEAVKVIKEWLPELELMARYNTSSIDYQRYKALNTAIKALEQEPKTGYWMHWISHYEEDEKVGWYECDRCHTERAFKTKFCPDCGAKMQEVGE